MVLGRLDSDERDRVRADVGALIGRFGRDGKLAVPAQALVVSAS
jgi:hypothetical protein